MNITISIPNGHIHAADKLAKKLGLSRNELYRKAIELYLEERSPESEPVAVMNDHHDDEDW